MIGWNTQHSEIITFQFFFISRVSFRATTTSSNKCVAVPLWFTLIADIVIIIPFHSFYNNLHKKNFYRSIIHSFSLKLNGNYPFGILNSTSHCRPHIYIHKYKTLFSSDNVITEMKSKDKPHFLHSTDRRIVVFCCIFVYATHKKIKFKLERNYSWNFVISCIFFNFIWTFWIFRSTRD